MTRIPVFISSKQSELHEDRMAVVEAVEQGEILEPVFAEDWAPRRAAPEDVYRAEPLRCPLYVGLFWRIYSAPTEDEYRATILNRETEILLYVRACPIEEREEPLRRLLDEFSARHSYCSYNSPGELRKLVPQHLDSAIVRMVNRLHFLGQQTRSPRPPGRLTPDELVRAWGLQGDAAEIIASLDKARNLLRAASAP